MNVQYLSTRSNFAMSNGSSSGYIGSSSGVPLQASSCSPPRESNRSRLQSFDEVLLTGLAPDGGLYVPDAVPAMVTGWDMVTGWEESLTGTQDLDTGRQGGVKAVNSECARYVDLATQVMSLYIGQSIQIKQLKALTADAYSVFRHRDVCPLVPLRENHYLLELFHGPTFAFKDIALQIVARLFEYELKRRGEHVTVIGATSGDTGSAAMHAVAGLEQVEAVILHPKGRTSEIQRRQMTTLTASNVHAVAVDGTFDDCQDLVKAMFMDKTFRLKSRLVAVNSINWARVMAQIVYYFWSYALLKRDQLIQAGQPVTFCVPTGNFGNVLAGHYARRMGLNINRLIVASNSNDILSRLISSGELVSHEVVATLSPSMDIQISSNLERLIFELLGNSGDATTTMLRQFRTEGCATLDKPQHHKLRNWFSGGKLTDGETLTTMASVYQDAGILIDPHTAVGVGVAERNRRPDEIVVTLATAHPAKFPEAVKDATGCVPNQPEGLEGIYDLPERCAYLPNNLGAVQDFVRSICRNN